LRIVVLPFSIFVRKIGGKTMFKRIALATLLVLAFSLSAFAGEGSDTIGACKLMPELRYSYYETPMTSDDWYTVNRGRDYFDWKEKEHNTVVQLTWGVIDNLDLYTFVGARICTTLDGTNDVGRRAVFDLGAGFTCGLGVKGTFWRSSNGFYLGGGASVAYGVTGNDRNARYYQDDVHVGDSKDDGASFQEQNLAAVADLHVGWHIGNTGLTPYLGVEYRWNKAYMHRESTTPLTTRADTQFISKEPIGPYVGLDYVINDRLSLNLEGHMIDRWGGSFSVGYLFDLCPVPVVPPVVPGPVIEPKLEPMSKN
jgi:hypothetical protein